MSKIGLKISLFLVFGVIKINAEKSFDLGELKLEIKGLEDKSIYAKTKVVKLKNLVASEVEPFIRRRLSAYGAVQVNDALNTIIITDMEPKLSDLVRLIKNFDAKGDKEFVQLETQTFFPKYVLPSKLRPILKKNLSPDGSIEVDDDLNMIMITDVQSKIERVKEILKTLDVPPKQVLIEGKIAVIDSDWLQKLGIYLPSLIKEAARNVNILVRDEEWKETDRYEDRTTQHERKIRGIYSSIRPNFAELISLIEQFVDEGKANINAIPSIIVQNNREGGVYISESGSHYNIKLSIVPQIGSEDFISLDITLRVESNAMRIYEKRSRRSSSGVNTTVMVKNGETFAIGGIEYTQRGVIERKIPILGSIPIINWLFKRQEKIVAKKEVVVFITPHILEFGESLEIERK